MQDAIPDQAVSVRMRAALLGVALVLGLALRFTYGWEAPLWLDETFSAVIASQPDIARLVGWCRVELSGPAFYMPLWFWTRIAGDSDFALRVPSLIWSLAAPALIWWRGHPDRDVRLFWTVIVLLWLPAAFVAAEARPYPQLFLLTAAQAIAYRRLIHAPAERAALVWGSVTALAVLTHYTALVIGGVQAILFLAYHRRTAIRVGWPAILPLIPAAAWLGMQLPFLLAYAEKHDAAFATLPLSTLLDLPTILFGVPFAGMTILIVVAMTLVFSRTRPTRITADGVAILSGIIAFAIIVALGFVRPNFAPRYLMSTMPAVLFGVACWLRWQFARDWKPAVVVIAVLALPAAVLLRTTLSGPDTDPRHANQIETASAWLAERPPARMILFWDGVIAAATPAERIGEVAGFFLKRAGHPVTVTVVRAGRRDDPNRAISAATHAEPDAAILWISDGMPSAARAPNAVAHSPDYRCRDFGGGVLVVLACRPAGAPISPPVRRGR